MATGDRENLDPFFNTESGSDQNTRNRNPENMPDVVNYAAIDAYIPMLKWKFVHSLFSHYTISSLSFLDARFLFGLNKKVKMILRMKTISKASFDYQINNMKKASLWFSENLWLIVCILLISYLLICIIFCKLLTQSLVKILKQK